MTEDEIIELAKKAGMPFYPHNVHELTGDNSNAQVVKFYELAAAKEREACARACESLRDGMLAAISGDSGDLSNVMLRQVAELGCAESAIAIRARWNK